jgi:hypothetical protein
MICDKLNMSEINFKRLNMRINQFKYACAIEASNLGLKVFLVASVIYQKARMLCD